MHFIAIKRVSERESLRNILALSGTNLKLSFMSSCNSICIWWLEEKKGSCFFVNFLWAAEMKEYMFNLSVIFLDSTWHLVMRAKPIGRILVVVEEGVKLKASLDAGRWIRVKLRCDLQKKSLPLLALVDWSLRSLFGVVLLFCSISRTLPVTTITFHNLVMHAFQCHHFVFSFLFVDALWHL